ncbi:hypothetical protein G7068_04540 [Leucobacter viscericola]|uniref:Uncharacterized protein n=1 Tax=Leucobacter viscericola TaxID=2714935 RepID=A0A6G7XDT4_9MICO|nr:hypothetical protein [Leucobacter viscericola]QIK62557.1 hypothetical protein G7068_04540 [Leucobacter viscericola]
MASLQLSPQHFRNGATNASTIGSAITSLPVRHLNNGDLGHAGVAAALTGFRDAWVTELALRKKAATDTERVDTLLANAAARIGNKK